MLNSNLLQRLDALKDRYDEIETLLAQPDVAMDYEKVATLSRERSGLEATVQLVAEYRATLDELQEAQELVKASDDEEMLEMAREEVERLATSEESQTERLRLALLPKDPADERDVIVEVRAGAGGDEAALFAGDLYRMYARYAQNKGWQVEVMNANETGIGGYKELIFAVRGLGAYSHLKHESGTHRVQRVPTTEASGRIHTSTATVAVLAEADEVDIDIDPKDLRVDIFHSGGPGGQNVNKVASAVRITHIPTGTISVCQAERSQHKNRAQAMSVLRARLLDMERQRQGDEIAQARRSMVGGGDRAEKIRTYNFPQSRVSDHRINLTLHNLDRVLEGEIDTLLEALTQAEQARLLEAALV